MRRVSGVQEASARKARWIASVSVVLVVLAVAVSCGFDEDHNFDPVKWRAESAISCPERKSRRQMVRDMRKNHLRLGMTQPEVKRLLGPPDGSWHRNEREEWDYGLGVRGSDCEYFGVWFAANGGTLVEWSADP